MPCPTTIATPTGTARRLATGTISAAITASPIPTVADLTAGVR